MRDNEPDRKPATIAAKKDRGERVALLEPLVLSQGSRHRPALGDLALELAQAASGFRRSLPDGVMTVLADLVRAMNCYYSNLIEGHDTHPVDIERALKEDYSADTGKRSLQLEAKAHIAVQKWIDNGALAGRATSVEGIIEVHRHFCERLPDDLLWVEHPQSKEKLPVVPGGLREHDVEVGRHVAPSPGAIVRFLDRFEAVYSELGRSETILATAAAPSPLSSIKVWSPRRRRRARCTSDFRPGSPPAGCLGYSRSSGHSERSTTVHGVNSRR